MENLLFLGVPILKHIMVYSKETDGMANSVGPDLHAPSGVRSGSALFGQTDLHMCRFLENLLA